MAKDLPCGYGLYIAACVFKVDKTGGQLYRAKEAPYVDIRETRTTFQTHVSSLGHYFAI